MDRVKITKMLPILKINTDLKRIKNLICFWVPAIKILLLCKTNSKNNSKALSNLLLHRDDIKMLLEFPKDI